MVYVSVNTGKDIFKRMWLTDITYLENNETQKNTFVADVIMQIAGV